MRFRREGLRHAFFGSVGAFQISCGLGCSFCCFCGSCRFFHNRLGRAKFQAHRLLAPQLLQVVILPEARLHDVYHRLPAVHNDPLAIGLAFHARLGEARLAHGITHAGGQRLGLAVGRARGDDHPLEQSGQMFGVKHLDILRLHVFEPIDDGALKFLNVFFHDSLSSHQV